MRGPARLMLAALMPAILMVAGAGLAGLGATWGAERIIWAGFGIIGGGIAWGILVFLSTGGAGLD